MSRPAALLDTFILFSISFIAFAGSEPLMIFLTNVPCNSSAFGTLRRSEICALTSADVEKNIIHINKTLVLNEQRVWVVKTTKTVSSIRDVDMPNYIIDLLPKSGNLVNLNPNQITHRFAKTLKTLDIHSFRFHDLRHYAASMMHAIGIPDTYIMRRGGWSSDTTLKNIYRGVMDDYMERFTAKAFDHIDKITLNRTQNRTQKIKSPDLQGFLSRNDRT